MFLSESALSVLRAQSSSTSMVITQVLTPSGKASLVAAAHSGSLADGKLTFIHLASPRLPDPSPPDPPDSEDDDEDDEDDGDDEKEDEDEDDEEDEEDEDEVGDEDSE